MSADNDTQSRDLGLSATQLRGKCKEFAEAACRDDESLRLVRGWYVDPMWGRQEHWWAERPDGSIHDPTSAQFPMGGVADWYEEFSGFYPCQNCGTEVAEADLVQGGCCSGWCFGQMVGLHVDDDRPTAVLEQGGTDV